MPTIFNKLFRFILLSLLLSSCSTVSLKPKGLNQNVIELSRTNQKKIWLKISNPTNQYSLGHQYLGIIFPIGNIRHQSIEQSLVQRLFTELSLRGFQIHFDIEKEAPKVATLKLNITLNRFQQTAYDLFFTRKVVTKINFHSTLSMMNQDDLELRSTHLHTCSEYAALPFTKKLQSIFESCLQESIVEALNVLEI